MRWKFSVNHLVRQQWQTIQQAAWANYYVLKQLYALSLCRTKELGGHIQACSDCAYFDIAYNSCGNRHCPTCGSLKREEWIARQEDKLLPVPYFHVVFTIPHQLNGLCKAHPRLMYSLLFRTAWQTIQAFAQDRKYLGAKTGMTAVLHTWGQNLSLHPHLHCIIPGGGITTKGKWKNTRTKGKYLFPKNALRKVFKGKFMEGLKDLDTSNTIDLPYELKEQLYRKKWIVYAKRPFASPKNVIEYLGRYTHKTAISNYRIQQVQAGKIAFQYKDYKEGSDIKIMVLGILEFLRRIALHLLPHGFARIRHFGLLSSRGQGTHLLQIQLYLEQPLTTASKEQIRTIALQRLKVHNTCPCCGQQPLTKLLPFGRDGPPEETYILNHILRVTKPF